jgi:hypothetical protein
MRGRLGGKRRPKVPDVVSNPRENFSGYFDLSMAGKRMPPRAMMVRPVAPVRAVKVAQVTRAMMESPPGSHPKMALESLTNLLVAPLSERRYPAKVKRGMATRTGVVAIRYISMMMAEESICPENKSKRVRPEMTAKIGAPKRSKRRQRIRREIEIIFHPPAEVDPLLSKPLKDSSEYGTQTGAPSIRK